MPFLAEFGHPLEPIGELEQILPDLKGSGLAGQPP
jgi:hypothetical protein